MPERLLIVDDNSQNLRLARAVLSAEGREIRTAIGAQEAVMVLETFVPDLILMDLQLPGIDGLELTRRLKADPRLGAVPIIALTAYATKFGRDKALAAGCADYITKPIDVDALPSVIAGHLARVVNR